MWASLHHEIDKHRSMALLCVLCQGSMLWMCNLTFHLMGMKIMYRSDVSPAALMDGGLKISAFANCGLGSASSDALLSCTYRRMSLVGFQRCPAYPILGCPACPRLRCQPRPTRCWRPSPLQGRRAPQTAPTRTGHTPLCTSSCLSLASPPRQVRNSSSP